MKILGSPLLALLLVACTAVESRPVDVLPGYRTFYGNHGILAYGQHSALENDAFIHAEIQGQRLPRWHEFLRVGAWSYNYPSGAKKAEVTYAIRWYTECCAGGPCDQPYEVLVEDFSVWWPNGQLLAEGSFGLTRVRLDTNCQGGAMLVRGVPSKSTRYWDSSGEPADASVLPQAGIDLQDL
jgi:hypothetical protein